MKKCALVADLDDLVQKDEKNQIGGEEIQATIKWCYDCINVHSKQISLNLETTLESIVEDLRKLCPVKYEDKATYDEIDVEIRSNDYSPLVLQTISLKNSAGSTTFHTLITITPSHTYTILYNFPTECKTNMYLYANDNNSEDDLHLGASASPITSDLLPPTAEPLAKDYPEHDLCDRVVGPNGDNGDQTNSNETVVTTATASNTSIISTEYFNYVGLVNQAMTCYLNSLVQALYMTPEFRNAIYNWEFDGINETRSIPYQLQRLFLNLQTSERSAVETTDLTTSFGWQGSEAWHQHDIQELCRVMFDALERKFKDTKQANLINDLYEGKMLDYVKCLECGTEKSREDTFLDIPLPVRPFGHQVAYNSIEEALRAFVQPETLDGNNQYHCEKCNKKCDAHKGLKFIKFPYLLTLHLKRFDFDYNTMHRIKLNDKVVFPEMLNLNSFVPNNRTDEHSVERESVVKCDDCSTTDSGSALDDESCQGNDLSSPANDHDENCEDSDEGIDVSSGATHHQEPEAKGPYNYELFSIMIHSGSASGGHYYAYIKDFDKDYWLCFNDQSVNRITEDDIRKTYGGGPQKGYYSGMYTSSTNAYMLMYRQIDKARNCNAMKMEEFPLHVQALLADMRNKVHVVKDKPSNSIRLSVNCYHPISDELMDIRLTVLYDLTLQDAAYLAMKRFKLEGIVNQEDCRLVAYNRKQACIDCSFDGDADFQFCDITENGAVCYLDWLLEIKEPGTPWRLYKKGGIDMRVYQINIENEDVKEPFLVRLDIGDTVDDLKTKLSYLIDKNIDSNSLQIVIYKFCCPPELLESDSMEVPFDYSSRDYKLYISTALNDAETIEQQQFNQNKLNCFESSKLYKIIERFEYIVHLNILLPDIDSDVLENLFIPSLDSQNNQIEQSVSATSLRISPQPLSNDAFGGDQSNSEDSSLSDSDRTLIGEAPSEYQNDFASSNSLPTDQHMTSPSDPAEGSYNYEILGNSACEEMHWDSTTHSPPLNSYNSSNLINTKCDNYDYFKMTSIKDIKRKATTTQTPSATSLTENTTTTYTRHCKVFVDNRTTLDEFKKHLERIVRVPREYFKIFRQYPNPDEELSNLNDTLRKTRDGQTLTVKLGRALSHNEHSIKVYYLKPESSDTNHFLFEHILAKGQTVAELKRECLARAKKLHNIDIPANKARLREKYMKKPRKVYLDDQTFAKDIIVIGSFEVFLQELQDIEKVTSTNQMVLFARHWCPSTLTLQPFQEIVLDTPEMDELKMKIVDLSMIPLEFLQVAFVRNVFPGDMHLLDIHSEMEWDKNIKSLDQWPLHADDGAVLYYRDGREQIKELTAEERKLVSIKENTRLGRVASLNGRIGEKSLRIYSDNWPSENEDCMD